jgi:hypothetical protein
MKEDEKFPSNINDEVRESILNFLYRVHKKARSRESARVSRSELKKELKKIGWKEQDIASNLDYLIQSGWVRVEVEESEFKTPRGFIRKRVKEYYKISDAGINFFEGPSKFQRLEKSISGINVTNIQGVTVIGDQNVVVNTQFIDLYRRLSLLSEIVRNSSHLSDEEKLNFTKDIDTIKDQLSKSSPDKNIIKLAWEKLKPLATISGVASFFKQVAELIRLIL